MAIGRVLVEFVFDELVFLASVVLAVLQECGCGILLHSDFEAVLILQSVVLAHIFGLRLWITGGAFAPGY